MRKILEQRLENARNDWLLDKKDYLRGQMVAYRDCLNLIPAPRTEQYILKDFETLGWKVSINNSLKLRMSKHCFAELEIDKLEEMYIYNGYLTMQEHKLLNELFECYSWL